MTPHLLADELRKLQMRSRHLFAVLTHFGNPIRILADLSDEEIIACYNKCPYCCEDIASQEQLESAIARSESFSEFAKIYDSLPGQIDHNHFPEVAESPKPSKSVGCISVEDDAVVSVVDEIDAIDARFGTSGADTYNLLTGCVVDWYWVQVMKQFDRYPGKIHVVLHKVQEPGVFPVELRTMAGKRVVSLNARIGDGPSCTVEDWTPDWQNVEFESAA